MKSLIIIGSGSAGIAAAEAARKQNHELDIQVFTEDAHLPYYRPRLFELASDSAVEEKIQLHPASWYDDKKIQLHLETAVKAIDPEKKEIKLQDDSSVPYDKLILATGSRSFVPPITGKDHPMVFSIWSMDDMKTMTRHFSPDKKAVVIGGGLLGLEAAWQISRNGMHVTVLENFSRLLGNQLDDDASALFKGKVQSLGIDVLTGVNTKAILAEDDKLRGVELESGELIDCDIVVISTGVRARNELTDALGAETGLRLKVDKTMKTSIEDIYAAGDSVELDGRWFGLWSIAKEEGEVAGTNAAGGEASYRMPYQPYVLNTMDTRVISAGDLKNLEDVDLEVEQDPEKFHYRKIIRKNGVLQGFMLLGDVSLGPKLLKELRG